MHYQLAPTDPRWLDADDETILRDMLILQTHNRDLWEAMHPTEALAEEAERNPEIAAAMERRKDEFMDDPGTQAALRSLGIGGKEEVKPAPSPLRLKGRIVVE